MFFGSLGRTQRLAQHRRFALLRQLPDHELHALVDGPRALHHQCPAPRDGLRRQLERVGGGRPLHRLEVLFDLLRHRALGDLQQDLLGRTLGGPALLLCLARDHEALGEGHPLARVQERLHELHGFPGLLVLPEELKRNVRKDGRRASGDADVLEVRLHKRGVLHRRQRHLLDLLFLWLHSDLGYSLVLRADTHPVQVAMPASRETIFHPQGHLVVALQVHRRVKFRGFRHLLRREECLLAQFVGVRMEHLVKHALGEVHLGSGAAGPHQERPPRGDLHHALGVIPDSGRVPRALSEDFLGEIQQLFGQLHLLEGVRRLVALAPSPVVVDPLPNARLPHRGDVVCEVEGGVEPSGRRDTRLPLFFFHGRSLRGCSGGVSGNGQGP
mmetsp:Transcript_102040/g.288131  ORF Transcript_102040/g.288131 Transcript_102040/m.288131 type:complete len:385 (+) Transcript_102040:570-1724(+)